MVRAITEGQGELMSAAVVTQQMAIIFILIAVGMFLYKKKMLSEMTSRQLSGLIVNVTNPALLISSALREGPRVSLQELGIALGVDLVVYGILIAVSLLIPRILRVPDQNHYSYRMLTVFGNVGFIGIPLATAVLGTESLIFVSIYNLFCNVLIYTFGISVLQKAEAGQIDMRQELSRQNSAAGSGKMAGRSLPDAESPAGRLSPDTKNPAAGRTQGFSWKKLVNVGTVSAAATIVIYISNLQAPMILSSTLDYIGQSTTLLSMLVLGISVAQMSVKDIFSHPRLYGFVLLRQIMLPVGCIFLLRPFIVNPLILNTMALMLAVPAGNLPLMLSKQMQIDTDTISQGIILTTVLSLVTIPAVSFFL